MIDTADTIPKLNFLIENVTKQYFGRTGALSLFGILALTILMVTGSFEKIGNYFFPGNEFIFGKQKQAFDRRQRLRSNLFWVGVVGLAVSVIAGFVVWYATRTN